MNPSTVDCYQFLNNMKLSHSEVTAIEATTRAQSESKLWILRQCVTTDSTRLVTDIMGYNGPLRHLPPALRWGQQNEIKARQCYVMNRQAFKEDMIVEPTGLHLLPGKSFLGASSDGKFCAGMLTHAVMGAWRLNAHIVLTPM